MAMATERLLAKVMAVALAATVAAAAAPPPDALEPAASGPAPEPPIGLTFSASARSVRVPVSVLDKSGQPVLGLREEDFTLSENGRRQPVTFFSGERQPMKVALALDVSGSMRDKTEEVAVALRHFINLLEPDDQVMVLTFSGSVHVDQEFTSDRQALQRVFSHLRADQGTALYDAAAEAIRRLSKEPAEGKAVVLVTDGVDTASSATFAEVRELARRSEVPVFSIGIKGGKEARSNATPSARSPVPRPPIGGRWPGGGGWPRGRGWPGGGAAEPEFDARPLRELAEDTGARAEILKADGSDRRLEQAVESIAVTLRHRYLVGYEPEPGKAGWRTIRVEVDRPSTRVQARKGYYAES